MRNDKKQTALDFYRTELFTLLSLNQSKFNSEEEIFDQAKAMEEEQGEKFNMFLDYEKSLGISDEKTIERIKWYYNTYFNETYEQ